MINEIYQKKMINEECKKGKEPCSCWGIFFLDALKYF